MNEILFGLAFGIYLFIANIIWFIICLIIWPFKKEFIYNWRQCSIYLINIHQAESCRKKGIKYKTMKYRKKFKGRCVSEITFDLIEDNYLWAHARYSGYIKYTALRGPLFKPLQRLDDSDGVYSSDLEFYNFRKGQEDQLARKESLIYDPISNYYKKRKSKCPKI